MPTWNPWHGCHKLSAGCKNCYVYRLDAKYDRDSSIVAKTGDFNLPVKKHEQKNISCRLMILYIHASHLIFSLRMLITGELKPGT